MLPYPWGIKFKRQCKTSNYLLEDNCHQVVKAKKMKRGTKKGVVQWEKETKSKDWKKDPSCQVPGSIGGDLRQRRKGAPSLQDQLQPWDLFATLRAPGTKMAPARRRNPGDRYWSAHKTDTGGGGNKSQPIVWDKSGQKFVGNPNLLSGLQAEVGRDLWRGTSSSGSGVWEVAMGRVARELALGESFLQQWPWSKLSKKISWSKLSSKVSRVLLNLSWH